MGTRNRLIARRVVLGLVLTVGVTACSACKRKEETPTEIKPPDHLAPSEVVEGKERAFGLPLPRTAHIAARFEKTVHVQTPLTHEELVNYVRARVKDGKVTPGTSGTQLFDVTPVGDPMKRLTIDVRLYRGGDGNHSEMIVRDTTPTPVEPGLTDEQRWQKAGLTPSGQIADPKKLQ
jgi:hypothetical protein